MNKKWGFVDSCMIIDEAHVWMMMFEGISTLPELEAHDQIMWWMIEHD